MYEAIRMQRHASHRAPSPKRQHPPKPNSLRKLVLCIDDEAPGLAVRKLLLEEAGYDVVTCCDGNKGLEMFAAMPVHIVLLDYAMPGLNGAQVAKVMREVKPNVPIVMLSGYQDQPGDSKDWVDIYVVKGGRPESLLAYIEKLLTARQTH